MKGPAFGKRDSFYAKKDLYQKGVEAKVCIGIGLGEVLIYVK